MARSAFCLMCAQPTLLPRPVGIYARAVPHATRPNASSSLVIPRRHLFLFLCRCQTMTVDLHTPDAAHTTPTCYFTFVPAPLPGFADYTPTTSPFSDCSPCAFADPSHPLLAVRPVSPLLMSSPSPAAGRLLQLQTAAAQRPAAQPIQHRASSTSSSSSSSSTSSVSSASSMSSQSIPCCRCRPRLSCWHVPNWNQSLLLQPLRTHDWLQCWLKPDLLALMQPKVALQHLNPNVPLSRVT